MKDINLMKKFVVLAILIAAPSLRAVDLPLTTLSELRVAVLNQMEHSTSGTALLTTAIIDEAVNRAQLKVASDFPAVEKLDTIWIGAGSTMKFYALNDDFLKLNWTFKYRGDTMLAIEYAPPQTLYQRDAGRTANVSQPDNVSYPRYCFISRSEHNGKISPKLFFFPMASMTATVDTILISYYSLSNELVDDNDSTEIAPEYRDPLVYWACSIASFRIGKLDLGTAFLNVYKECLALSKLSEIKQPFERGFPVETVGK